ncbi:MAG: hypothetical protein P8Q52_14910 [Acidimicrobiales bacterium]|nr:hypothetical protein [Acidimicrobiales bacterium]
MAGGTHHEAAETAGVQRPTVTGWANKNIPFITEMETRRAARSHATADRFDDVIANALDVVGDKIADGDLTAALAVLKLARPDRLTSRLCAPSLQSTQTNLASNIQLEQLGEGFVDDFAFTVVQAKSWDSADPVSVLEVTA